MSSLVNDSGLPEQEPTSRTAIVLCGGEAITRGTDDRVSATWAFGDSDERRNELLRVARMEGAFIVAEKGGVKITGRVDHIRTPPDFIRIGYGEWEFRLADPGWTITVTAPKPMRPGAGIPDEVVEAAVEAATREWDSGRSVAYSDAMRLALAAADAKRAELTETPRPPNKEHDMTANLNAIAAIIEAHEPNTVGCTECDWTPGSSGSFSEHVARSIIDTMGEQPTCKTLPSGGKQWWLDGKLHRTDGPAVEWADGHKAWWLDDKRHRTDGPAVERPDGGKQWWLHGKLHRTDGPAIERADGSKEWWLDGKQHRTDGPAVERADGGKQWWLHGELHRTDGPAIERADGHKAWYLNGKRLTEAEHAKRTA